MGEPGTAEGEKGGGALEGEGSSSAVLCLASEDCVGARYCVPCKICFTREVMKWIGKVSGLQYPERLGQVHVSMPAG